jgi:hypothetical protein
MWRHPLRPSLGRLASGLAIVFPIASLIQNTQICREINCVDLKSPVDLVAIAVNQTVRISNIAATLESLWNSYA